jgi:hypothetical protein
MQTTVTQPKAIKLFFMAANYYTDAQTRKENKAEELRKAEEQELKALPWYKRIFCRLDDWTGHREDMQAVTYAERRLYCYRQIEILNTLSSRSVIRLTQRDLEILNLGE